MFSRRSTSASHKQHPAAVVLEMCQSLQPHFAAWYQRNLHREYVSAFRRCDSDTGKHILHFGGELLDYQANYTPWGNLQSGNFNFTEFTPSKTTR